MRNHPALPSILAPMVFLALAACDDSAPDAAADAAAGGGADVAAVNDIAGDLPAGAYELSVAGAWDDAGEYTGDSEPTQYRRASDGSNHHGPHLVRLRTDLIGPDGEEAPGKALFILPDGITPGTYPVTSANDPGEDEVTARVRSSYVPFVFGGDGTEVEGTFEIGEVGERLTARFEYTARDRDGASVSAEGRVHAIPFEFTPEGEFEVSGDTEDEWHGGVRVHESPNGVSVTLGNIFGRDAYSFSLELPPGIEAGTYALTSERDAEGVRVAVGDGSEVDGELRVERDGEVAHGELTFDFRGGDHGQGEVSGAFEYVPVQE